MRRALTAVAFLALGGSACDDAVAPIHSGTGGGGSLVDGCAAGERDVAGACQAAGIPSEACLEGFVWSDGACEPILPDEPCPAGLIAVPGDRRCRPVMPCGRGTWGDIPVDATSEHVDSAYAGPTSNGDADAPWTTVGEAVTAAADGAIVAIAAGIYAEDVFIDKRVRLWGRCPELVTIFGQAIQPSAVVVGTSGADGAEIRGIAVSGPQAGIYAQDVASVIVERVHVHDTHAFAGLGGQADALDTALTVRDSLIEDTFQAALSSAGSTLVVERSLVRDPNTGEGTGIRALPHPTSGRRGSLTVRFSVVERNRVAGVGAAGVDATLEGVVVRDTDSRSDGLGGAGILIRDDPGTSERGRATIVGSLSERNRLAGIQVADADAEIRWSTARDNLPQRADAFFGRGIQVSTEIAGAMPSHLTVVESLVRSNREVGLLIAGANATLAGVVIEGTEPREADGNWGLGLRAQAHPSHGLRTTVMLDGNVIRDNAETGISVLGSDLTARTTVVTGTRPRAADGLFGRGITIQYEPTFGAPASAALEILLVRDNHDTGLLVFGADATLAHSLIADTRARAADGQFGDGVAVDGDDAPASLAISASQVERSARAGVASFAGEVTLRDSAFTCNLVDLNGEALDASFRFEDQGGNHCGCAELGECRVLSSNLAAPDAP